MQKEIIETGRTIDEAIESACLKLDCHRDDCKWEIVDLPKKAFFGLKSIPAKVKVSIEVPDPKPEIKAPPIEKLPTEVRKSEARSTSPQPRSKAVSAAASSPLARQEEKAPKRAERDQPENDISPEEIEAKSAMAIEYVKSIGIAMGLEAEVFASHEEGGLLVKIEGKGLGAMIGRRGETLDAVQYLTGLAINRMEGSYLRITIDCGDYRLKRQKTLESLARRLSAQVLKTNVSKMVEPMNPFERRIIHATVSQIEGVSSISVGEEPSRRVVISSPTSRKASSRSDFRGEGGRRRDGGGRGGNIRDRGERQSDGRRPQRSGGRPPRPKQEVPSVPKPTPEATVDGNPLYAKIDLE